jgi:hypothetical protein
MKTKDLTDIIYDTLMGNIGMSKDHVGLNLDIIDEQEVDANNGEISFNIDGEHFVINITKTHLPQ